MKRIIVRDRTEISPFGEPARELRVLNKPLWLLQRDLLKDYCKSSVEIDELSDLDLTVGTSDEELIVYRDNLYFNANLINEFIKQARAYGNACQIAFRASSANQRGDGSIERHAIHLQEQIVRRDDTRYIDQGRLAHGAVYLGPLYYFPAGLRAAPTPLLIDTLSGEMGYYRIPSYMADRGELVYQIPTRAFLSIESWVHIFLANTPMGVFSWARETDMKMLKARLHNIRHWTAEDWNILPDKIALLLTAAREKFFGDAWRNHFFASSKLVTVGKNCSIDPSAVIHGPTIIGDNVYIGPGVVIANSLIGNNVNIMQGSQVMLSVVSDRCFLPFNAGLFMTTLMEHSMVAQNSTLQMTVVGRNTFIGANNCFTDFNLQNEPIKTPHKGRLAEVHMPVLGSAVGHNVKIGSGFVVYPGRTIGSNTVIIFDNEKSLIRKGVPGRSVEDVDEETGEPRRTVYHWPNVYYDPDQPDPRVPTPASPDDAAAEHHSNGADQAHINGAESAATMHLKPKQAAPVRVNATLGGMDL
jgi:carbonic anhydrase/acetyltransferase-like protein (isoleucine patch superfamily)